MSSYNFTTPRFYYILVIFHFILLTIYTFMYVFYIVLSIHDCSYRSSEHPYILEEVDRHSARDNCLTLLNRTSTRKRNKLYRVCACVCINILVLIWIASCLLYSAHPFVKIGFVEYFCLFNNKVHLETETSI